MTVKTGFSELLQSVQEKSKEFITTHRSYAVNIEKVVRIGRTECVLSDSSVIPVSRSFYKEVNEAFIKYHLGRERGKSLIFLYTLWIKNHDIKNIIDIAVRRY